MKTIKLIPVKHSRKVGDVCEMIPPNVVEDCFLEVDGEVIGFYIRDTRKVNPTLSKFVDIANSELRSKRVPKSVLSRSSAINARRDGGSGVEQYSTIIGSVPPKPHMRRAYPTRSSVHDVKSAEVFIKAMLVVCRECEELIKNLTPHIYEQQVKIITDAVPKQWRLGTMFTSSISNFNISASYHIDNANLKGCVNVILSKREGSRGGNLSVPDYDAVFGSYDNSMLVYPAWRNLHGVTPIVPTEPKGYRNTLVFYPLKAFRNVDNLDEKLDNL
jgi:hypothetical protein